MSEELIPCPFCEINDWQYHAHFSGATIRQCGGCGTIIDESIINTRPIEDALIARIAELEAKNERYIKLIQDWVDVLDPRYPQGDGLASAVRQAMLEINKESEE